MTIFGFVFLLFLALKLVGIISWSWWAITAPLWVPWCAAMVLLLFIGTRK